MRRPSQRILADLFIAVLFVSAICTTAVTPPFQSPDEFAHVQRAYLLSKGMVLLESSGGMIDTGLVSYMNAYQRYPFHPHRKVSPEAATSADDIEWSGTKQFVYNPAAAYFPIAYAPQAFGLAMGEALSLSVDTSYRLARLCALLASLALLFIAFRVFNPPLVVLALLIIPMSLFQISSASLDGVANSAAILGISAFARVAVDRRATRPWVLWTLFVTTLIVVTSREYLVPMLLLVFGAFFFTRQRKCISVGLFLTFAIAAWVWLAMTTAANPSPSGLTVAEGIAYYATHPMALIDVFANTLANDILFYAASFVGILGWLDAPLRIVDYAVFCALILLLLVAALRFKGSSKTWGARTLLLVSSVVSLLVMFLWMLIAWTQHPASKIEGVQGRYFLIPIVMIAYALSLGRQGEGKTASRRTRAIPVLVALVVFSVFTTVQTLEARYYPNTKYSEPPRVINPMTGQFGDLAANPIAEEAYVARATENWWASRDYSYNHGVAIGSDYVRVRSVDGSFYVYPWRDPSGY